MATQTIQVSPTYIFYIKPSVDKKHWTINAEHSKGDDCTEYYCINFDDSNSCTLYFLLDPSSVREGWTNLVASNTQSINPNVTVAGPSNTSVTLQFSAASKAETIPAIEFAFTNKIGSQLGPKTAVESLLLTASFNGENYTSDDPRLGTTPPQS